MKNKTLTFFTLIIAVTVPNIIKASTDSDGNQRQLEEIEKYISRQRQTIEDFYADKLIELQLGKEEEISLLEVADKGNFASLAAQARIAETVLGTEEKHKLNGRFEYTIDKLPRRFVATPSGIIEVKTDIFAAAAEAKEDIFAAYDFAAVQSRIAEEKSNILAAYEMEIAKLGKQKRYALTVRLPELEKKLKESISPARSAATYGLVTGIVYSEEPSVIIDGQIVHQKSAIHNVNVLKITEKTIEFEKNGRTWSQKVQETPNALWR